MSNKSHSMSSLLSLKNLTYTLSPFLSVLFMLVTVLAAIWIFASNKNPWSLLFLFGCLINFAASVVFLSGHLCSLYLFEESGSYLGRLFLIGNLLYLLGGLLSSIGLLAIAKAFAFLNRQVQAQKLQLDSISAKP